MNDIYTQRLVNYTHVIHTTTTQLYTPYTHLMDYMNNIFHPYLDIFIVVLIDATLIYSKNQAAH